LINQKSVQKSSFSCKYQVDTIDGKAHFTQFMGNSVGKYEIAGGFNRWKFKPASNLVGKYEIGIGKSGFTSHPLGNLLDPEANSIRSSRF
jgi:hypothetical protein